MSIYASVISVLAKPLSCFALVLFTALIASGCTKSEPPKQTATPDVLPIVPAPPPPAETEEYVPRKTVDYMAGIKDIKDFKPVVKKAEPLKEAAANVAPTPRKVADIKAAPAETKVAETPPLAPPAPPQLILVKAPADNLIAKAAPSSQAPPVVTTATPVRRETPEFPREAIKASVESGVVRAVMSIDASGNVTNVQIVESRPARVFDRAVRDSLGRWRFNAGADGRSYQTEVEFRR